MANAEANAGKDGRPDVVQLPATLFGTQEWVDGSHEPAEMEPAVTAALEAGYVGVDCAEMYQTTKATAAALAHHRDVGGAAGAPSTTFVCTKLRGLATAGIADADLDYAAVKTRTAAHLAELGVSRANLILMHWPGDPDADLAASLDHVAAACAWAHFDANIDRAWANMQRLRADGVTTAVGVSNFYKAAFDRLVAGLPPGGGAVPAANQIFIDATHPEYEFVAELQGNGVAVLAYRPLAFIPAIEMAGQMGDQTYAELAAAAVTAGATDVRQFVLGWLVHRGVIPVVKSRVHAATNLAAVALGSRDDFVAPDEIFGPSELVDMCGGSDEYAAVFKALAP